MDYSRSSVQVWSVRFSSQVKVLVILYERTGECNTDLLSSPEDVMIGYNEIKASNLERGKSIIRI